MLTSVEDNSVHCIELTCHHIDIGLARFCYSIVLHLWLFHLLQCFFFFDALALSFCSHSFSTCMHACVPLQIACASPAHAKERNSKLVLPVKGFGRMQMHLCGRPITWLCKKQKLRDGVLKIHRCPCLMTQSMISLCCHWIARHVGESPWMLMCNSSCGMPIVWRLQTGTRSNPNMCNLSIFFSLSSILLFFSLLRSAHMILQQGRTSDPNVFPAAAVKCNWLSSQIVWFFSFISFFLPHDRCCKVAAITFSHTVAQSQQRHHQNDKNTKCLRQNWTIKTTHNSGENQDQFAVENQPSATPFLASQWTVWTDACVSNFNGLNPGTTPQTACDLRVERLHGCFHSEPVGNLPIRFQKLTHTRDWTPTAVQPGSQWFAPILLAFVGWDWEQCKLPAMIFFLWFVPARSLEVHLLQQLLFSSISFQASESQFIECPQLIFGSSVLSPWTGATWNTEVSTVCSSWQSSQWQWVVVNRCSCWTTTSFWSAGNCQNWSEIAV